ncbi:hypothetical protein MMC13_001790 [Lambiella insularis]|nr:hypothetical protein [Lambiella insularis]
MEDDPAEFYLRMEDDFDECEETSIILKDKQLPARIRSYWNSYCALTRKDPVETIREFRIQVLKCFFHWLLKERKDTLRGARSLRTYWNVLGQLRRKETGGLPIDTRLKTQMNGVLQRLTVEFGLETKRKEKPIMRAEDEFELLKTLYTSPEILFDHERHHVELALIIQLAGITGNRPAALLALTYENVEVTVLLVNERPRVLIEITFDHTKGYLGDKDANTFGIPDVPSEPCLLLCSQISFLTLAFADDAFAAHDLTSLEILFRLGVLSGQKQQPVPWKEGKLKTPIFRRSLQTVSGNRISPDEFWTTGVLHSRMVTLGNITGIELPTGAYTFRRGNGESLDNSSFISESQRNLILQHHSSTVFQRNYASRYMPDTHAAYRGLEPQVAVMRAASGMSRTIDRRRPKQLTESQRAEVDRHPEIKLLFRTRTNLRALVRDRGGIKKVTGTALHANYESTCREYRKKAFLKEVKSRYKREQPVIDIQRQLRGESLDEKDPTLENAGLRCRRTLSAHRLAFHLCDLIPGRKMQAAGESDQRLEDSLQSTGRPSFPPPNTLRLDQQAHTGDATSRPPPAESFRFPTCRMQTLTMHLLSR